MKNNSKVLLIIFWGLMKTGISYGQITPAGFEQYIRGSGKMFKEELREFYSVLYYRPAWTREQDLGNLALLLRNIQDAKDVALEPGDYDGVFIESVIKHRKELTTAEDTMAAELIISSVALRFYTDLASGNTKPALSYTGFTESADTRIIDSLTNYIRKGKLDQLAATLSRGISEIPILQNKLRWILLVMKDTGFREVTNLTVKSAGDSRLLSLKLFQLGLSDSAENDLAGASLKQAIKKAQQMFGLLADGVLRSTLIQELNVPLATRVQQLNCSINYYRWLNKQVGSQAVVSVNIPAAYLKVYHRDTVILEMKIVVGKPSTPTPTLSSIITEVILYPYWHVPFSIATKEILPLIKKNPAYLNTAGFQLLDKNGKIISPSSVNWKSINRSYFPYTIRQSTGCDNALGLLKLNFYNPFGVYLHDTPNKYSFSLNKRYFSHGCMRMEKPMELGHMILGNNSIAIDTLEQKGCLRNQSPVIVPALNRIPVVVWYNPAGTDAQGRVLFYEDIYKRFRW